MPTPALQDTHQSPVINGCIDELKKGISLLNSISDSDYVHLALPHIESSIGEHFRHILDLFQSLIQKSPHEPINYNVRRRGHEIETNKKLAITELNDVIRWLALFPIRNLASTVSLVTEVCPYRKKDHIMLSSIEREITFASLHASHHYALIKIITLSIGINTQSNFGLAPTTTSYVRGEV
ncbi:hypothetical protein [Aliivibrio sifiae]|uniref:DinB-like domain-containing protein n=1 Tax=Aliivibrio sifiae TaxID=566293 RepID=A0A2S7X1H4_9GAMM|nr:hypothetical protein [Aliivibrio sifiae]PQJ83482.1 hypothetical protein BTO22_19045 [Aliivibrio sifiae]